MEELRTEHTSGQWRLFNDSSKVSLKAVLLHNGKKSTSIPLANAVHMTETYKMQSTWQKHTKSPRQSHWLMQSTWQKHTKCSPHDRNIQNAVHMAETYKMQSTWQKHTKPFRFAAKNTLWKTPVEYMCWPNVLPMVAALQSGYAKYCRFIVNGKDERGNATTEYKNGHSVQKQHRG